MTDAQIIAEVRSWIGTPWKHGVALKGWGVDCGQFVIEVCKALGWVSQDFEILPYHADYSLHNTKSIMREELERLGAAELDDKNDIKVGDILLFLNGKCEAHTGIAVAPDVFVHAHIRNGVISEQLAPLAHTHVSTWRLA